MNEYYEPFLLTEKLIIGAVFSSSEEMDTGAEATGMQIQAAAQMTREQRVANFMKNQFPRLARDLTDNWKYHGCIDEVIGKIQNVSSTDVSSGLNPDSKEFYDKSGGGTSLHWAVRMEDTTMVANILAKDIVDVNAEDLHWKSSALHWAVRVGNMDIVKVVVTKYLELQNCQNHVRDKWGYSALHWAILSGKGTNITMVKELLKCKDIMTEDALITEAANILGANSSTDVQSHFNSQRESWYGKVGKGGTSLHWAVREKDAAMVKMILARVGVDVNAKDKSGETALHWAVSEKDARMVEMILAAAEVDVNAKDNSGETALQWAVREKDARMVEKILAAAEVDVNAKDNLGKTALHWAIREKDAGMVEMILAAGVDVNVKNNLGEPALHRAIKEDAEMVTLVLTANGVDVNAKNNLGEPALHWAVREKDAEMVALVLKANGVDVNAKNNLGVTAFQWAIREQDAAMAAMFLAAYGIHVGVRNQSWESIGLILAVKTGNVDFVKAMVTEHVESGKFDVNGMDEGGYTALHWAIMSEKGENANMVRELLKCKDTIRMTEDAGDVGTPLQIAHVKGYKDIQKALMEHEAVRRYVEELYRDRQVYVDAANAILVGAALIASVTFASWLQPPLGYGPNNYVDIEDNGSLQAFWMFNCLSFYFAIATVVFGARSVLPRSRYFIKVTVEKLRKNLLATAVLLACSTFFVIIAFALAGCMVLMPILKIRLFMIVPTIIGGVVCIISLAFLFKSMWEDI